MSARQLLTKALHILDRGDPARGEAVLREAVAQARDAGDAVTVVAGLCCLGELLAAQGRRPEAVDTLRACLAAQLPEEMAEVCDAERSRAREILARLG